MKDVRLQRIARTGAALGLAALLALAGGCVSDGGRGGSKGDRIGEIHLFGLPVALDLDGRPGPDGVGVRVFVSDGVKARGIPIRDGRLEVSLYDGGQVEGRNPLRTWTFSPRELAPVAVENSLGTGYQLVLRWAPARPTARSVTVVARYIPATGPDLRSEPNSIPL